MLRSSQAATFSSSAFQFRDQYAMPGHKHWMVRVTGKRGERHGFHKALKDGYVEKVFVLHKACLNIREPLRRSGPHVIQVFIDPI
jgi:hypothetical protein